MKNITVRIIVIFLLVNWVEMVNAQVKQQLRGEIEKIIRYDTEIDERKIPGLAIAVLDHDSIYYYGYGTVDKSKDVLPDEHTIFEIGGLTKVFAASLVSILDGEGILKKDTTVNTYLSEFERNKNDFNPTLKALLTHTSGLGQLPDNFGEHEKIPENPFAFYSQKDLFDFYRNLSVGKNKEGKYVYSHVGYAILERVVTNAMKKSFVDVMREKLIRPLDMSETKFFLPDSLRTVMAKGYNRAGEATPAWQYNSFIGAMGLKSTAFDLVKFLQAHMEEERFAKMQIPYANTGFDKRSFVGEGWHLLKRRKHFVVTAIGVTKGYRAFVAFVKATKTGVVVLSNSTNSHDNLGMLILKMLNNNWRRKQ